MNEIELTPPGEISRYYGLDELGERLGISGKTIRREISRGNLQAVRVGARLLVSAVAATAWLEKKSEVA